MVRAKQTRSNFHEDDIVDDDGGDDEMMMLMLMMCMLINDNDNVYYLKAKLFIIHSITISEIIRVKQIRSSFHADYNVYYLKGKLLRNTQRYNF